MTRAALVEEIKKKKSFLCVGLDTDIARIPEHLLGEEDPVFEFNKQIIEATHDLCIAYKPNIAFYECLGVKGWQSLEKTLEVIPDNLFTIADAKRGDIGNTSRYYAKTFFEHYNFDSLTIAPYMGEDSVTPFMEYEGKWVILLALTSNKGALDFQTQELTMQRGRVYERVLETSQEWGTPSSLMYVVGATRTSMLEQVRKIVPDHFLLVPGVGAQGGSLEQVAKYGLNDDCGLIVNASRSILYASSGRDFAVKAREAALDLQQQMEAALTAHGWS